MKEQLPFCFDSCWGASPPRPPGPALCGVKAKGQGLRLANVESKGGYGSGCSGPGFRFLQ